MGERIAVCSRQTKETTIQIKLNLDGTGKSDIHTGIGFFDHMLAGFAKHGLFDLEVSVKGDLEVDCHHTIEDTGIVIGEAIKKRWVRKPASNVMAIFFCRWMKRLPCVQSICPEDHTLHIRQISWCLLSGIWTRRW